jgi:23S rRNA pseudouridine1911/1915/1917 synthase
VHLSYLGHPIVGDDMYGGKHTTERMLGGPSDAMLLARQALHATTLGFRHPMTEQPMTFTAPVAADIARAVELLRASTRAAHTEPALTAPGTTISLPSAGL